MYEGWQHWGLTEVKPQPHTVDITAGLIEQLGWARMPGVARDRQVYRGRCTMLGGGVQYPRVWLWGCEHCPHSLARVGQCTGLNSIPQIHVHLELLNVTLWGNRALSLMLVSS